MNEFINKMNHLRYEFVPQLSPRFSTEVLLVEPHQPVQDVGRKKFERIA
jgi:hypothetical protein